MNNIILATDHIIELPRKAFWVEVKPNYLKQGMRFRIRNGESLILMNSWRVLNGVPDNLEFRFLGGLCMTEDGLWKMECD